MKSTEELRQTTPETRIDHIISPNNGSSMRNFEQKGLKRKDAQIFESKKTDSEKNEKFNEFTLTSHFLNKKKKNLNEKKTNFEKISEILIKILENIYTQIFILLCSLFTLLIEDLKILALPLTADKPSDRINEFIFFLFLLEFIVTTFCKKNFRGSFYFYLDLISIISMIPDVQIIWSPIVGLIENSSTTIKEILGNSYFAKGTKASQAGAKYDYF